MGKPVVPSVVVSVLVLGGCGDGGYGQPSDTTSTTTTVGAAETTPPSADATPSTAPSDLAGEDLTADQAAQLQQDVDAGHQPWRLDEVAVAEAFVAGQLGWTGVDSRLTDPQTVEVTNRPDGAVVTLRLQRPVREGPDGVWVVAAGQRLG